MRRQSQTFPYLPRALPECARVLSKGTVIACLSAPFMDQSIEVLKGIEILYRVFVHYCAHPFPAVSSGILEAAFYRGLLLITGLYECSTEPGLCGPCRCGPRWGHALTYRAASVFDHNRRMFRFLASKLNPPLRKENRGFDQRPTLLPVSRFVYHSNPEHVSGEASSPSDLRDTIVIQDQEDERDMDLIDVLLETHPKHKVERARTYTSVHASTIPGPYRDSFRSVLPTLSRPGVPLAELSIPLDEWRDFMKLLLVSSFKVCKTHLDRMFSQKLGQKSELQKALNAMTFSFVQTENEYIEWNAFNRVISRSMVRRPFFSHSPNI